MSREDRQVGVGDLGQPRIVGAQDAHRGFAALDIAAEPDQVVGGAARQAARPDCGRASRPPAAAAMTRSTGLALTTQTSAAWPPRCMAMAVVSSGRADAGEAAGHDGPAVGGAGGIDAQGDRPRLEPAVDIDRRGRERHRLLADEARRRRPRAASSSVGALARRRASRRARCCSWSSKGRRGREGRADHHAGRGCRGRAGARAAWPHHQVAIVGQVAARSPSSAWRCAA